MFNDRYCLTEAVLNGTKTMTRRIPSNYIDVKINILKPDTLIGLKNGKWVQVKAKYKVGEIVAVAQSYRDAGITIIYRTIGEGYRIEKASTQKGWENKMYVGANLMPHQIQVTNVRVERLQDISDEDCLKEGLFKDGRGKYFDFNTPQEAFASLINKINGKGTWEKNHYVFVYEFKLIK